MSTPAKDTTTVTDLTQLCIGEMVEAHQLSGPLLYQGAVELVVPQQGVLWIRYGALKERKLLDISEYQLCRRSASASQQSH
jgi:hypothetical protein